MQNAHERAIEIATALMIEHLKINESVLTRPMKWPNFSCV